MMKKTLVALAATAAVGSFAQTVTLSGRASMDYSTYAATGSVTAANDLASRGRVADTGSRLTFSVTEDLGGGLRAGVYCETGFAMDVASANNQANVASSTPSTSEWCARDSRLSLGGDTAEFRIGRQNIWWQQGVLNDSGSNKIGSDVSSNFFNAQSLSITRQDNTMKLVGGKNLGAFAGSEVFVAVPTNQEAAGSGVVPSDKGQNVTGLSLKYAFDKFAVQVDQVTANTVTSSTANTFDKTAARYGLGYLYAPGSIVSFQYYNGERQDKTTPTAAYRIAGDTSNASTTNTGSAKNSGYIINLNHDFGNNFTAVAVYARANNITTGQSGAELADSGAVGYSLGGMYRLSKRTHAYGALHSIQNGASSNIGMGAGGYQSGTNSFGSTVNITALGLIHNF